MVKRWIRSRRAFRFYFGLSAGLLVIVALSQIMETQLDVYFTSQDLASKLVAAFLLLFFVVVGAFGFFIFDLFYDGVISRMLGAEREK